MPTELKIPEIGESISEVQIAEWHKAENDSVANGEGLVTIESEKASLELPSPADGRLVKILKQRGETARVGEVIAQIEDGNGQPQHTEVKTAEQPPAKPAETKPSANKPSERASREAASVESKPEPDNTPAAPSNPSSTPPEPEQTQADVGGHPAAPKPVAAESTRASREEEIVPMSPLRRTAARRLVEAQRNAALLTTFNEADMTAVMALRKELGETFAQKYGAKLGYMSFFVKAAVDGLKQAPHLNAEVRGTDILFRNYYDIGIAISSARGLVVPVLRNAERLSFAEIELAISGMVRNADTGNLKPADLAGGTFTISNGGVFGSLLSTPIVNPPQSGVLGMHAIQERPIAAGGQVVIRPMMYLALTYDHRLVDGKEGVTFLKRIKEAIENPARMLLEV